MAIFNPSHFSRRPHEQPTAAASGHGLPPTYEESQHEGATNGARHEVRPFPRQQAEEISNGEQVFLNVRLHFQDGTRERRLLGGTLPDRDTIHAIALMLFVMAICYFIFCSTSY